MKNKWKNKKSKIVRGILFLVGVILFLWFMAPYLSVGILNIGNLTGMVLSVMLMVYVALMPMIHDRIKVGWKKRCLKPLLAFAGGMIVLCVVLGIVETGCMMVACANAPEENATAS